jgi:hypothetical protein
VRRYADFLPFTLILATEEPGHPICQQVVKDYGVELLPLKAVEAGFLESRAAALRDLALSGRFLYVLPMQEDFLLEGRPMMTVIRQALELMENHPISSMRLMPCPGPRGVKGFQKSSFRVLEKETDTIIFTYQATIWRRADYLTFMDALIAYSTEKTAPTEDLQKKQNNIAIKINLAEIHLGQSLLHSVLPGKQHIAWIREGDHPNAVYLCPWPYRPTAVVRGQLESWAADLAKREGFALL